LFALPPAVVDSGKVQVPRYQFTFNAGRNSFSNVYCENELVEFLTDELALESSVVSEAMDLLREVGKASIPNVELSENDAAAFGLQEVGNTQ